MGGVVVNENSGTGGETDDLSIEYESSDGELMAESWRRWDAPVETVITLKSRFVNRPDVYVSGDLLVYYRGL